jgi:hypothetical protein
MRRPLSLAWLRWARGFHLSNSESPSHGLTFNPQLTVGAGRAASGRLRRTPAVRGCQGLWSGIRDQGPAPGWARAGASPWSLVHHRNIITIIMVLLVAPDRPPTKGDQKAENAEKSRKYEAKDGAKLNGVRRCDGLQEPRFSGRRLGFCTISGPEVVWPGGVLRVVASLSSSAEGRYAPDVPQRRPAEEMWQLRSLHGPRPNEAQKGKMQWQRGRSCSRAQHSTGQARVQAGGVV